MSIESDEEYCPIITSTVFKQISHYQVSQQQNAFSVMQWIISGCNRRKCHISICSTPYSGAYAAQTIVTECAGWEGQGGNFNV